MGKNYKKKNLRKDAAQAPFNTLTSNPAKLTSQKTQTYETRFIPGDSFVESANLLNEERLSTKEASDSPGCRCVYCGKCYNQSDNPESRNHTEVLNKSKNATSSTTSESGDYSSGIEETSLTEYLKKYGNQKASISTSIKSHTVLSPNMSNNISKSVQQTPNTKKPHRQQNSTQRLSRQDFVKLMQSELDSKTQRMQAQKENGKNRNYYADDYPSESKRRYSKKGYPFESSGDEEMLDEEEEEILEKQKIERFNQYVRDLDYYLKRLYSNSKLEMFDMSHFYNKISEMTKMSNPNSVLYIIFKKVTENMRKHKEDLYDILERLYITIRQPVTRIKRRHSANAVERYSQSKNYARTKDSYTSNSSGSSTTSTNEYYLTFRSFKEVPEKYITFLETLVNYYKSIKVCSLRVEKMCQQLFASSKIQAHNAILTSEGIHKSIFNKEILDDEVIQRVLQMAKKEYNNPEILTNYKGYSAAINTICQMENEINKTQFDLRISQMSNTNNSEFGDQDCDNRDYDEEGNNEEDGDEEDEEDGTLERFRGTLEKYRGNCKLNKTMLTTNTELYESDAELIEEQLDREEAYFEYQGSIEGLNDQFPEHKDLWKKGTDEIIKYIESGANSMLNESKPETKPCSNTNSNSQNSKKKRKNKKPQANNAVISDEKAAAVSESHSGGKRHEQPSSKKKRKGGKAKAESKQQMDQIDKEVEEFRRNLAADSYFGLKQNELLVPNCSQEWLRDLKRMITTFRKTN